MKLSQLAGARPPARTLVLESWVFADAWADRPVGAICVGLRLMSEADRQRARSEAERLALELHPRGGLNAVDAFNDALLRQTVAHGICDPNDVTKEHERLQCAEDAVGIALTSRGARFIFDALERYEIEASSSTPEASDEDLEELSRLLQCGVVDLLPTARSGLVRRLLATALDEIRPAAAAAA